VKSSTALCLQPFPNWPTVGSAAAAAHSVQAPSTDIVGVGGIPLPNRQATAHGRCGARSHRTGSLSLIGGTRDIGFAATSSRCDLAGWGPFGGPVKAGSGAVWLGIWSMLQTSGQPGLGHPGVALRLTDLIGPSEVVGPDLRRCRARSASRRWAALLLLPLVAGCVPAALASQPPATNIGATTQSGAASKPAVTVTRSPAEALAVTATTDVSWNKHVTCPATITTLGKVLGTQRSALGGATFAGGGFKPGIPDKRSTNPPCSVSGVPTLVELQRVQFASCSKINSDGDWTCELTDPANIGKVPADLNAIHVELDGNFRAIGWAPAIPPGGKLLDIQGFVYWDPGHTSAAWHHHSGWEIHSFTAWRIAQ
jgi:hypothetical protein